MAKAKKDVEIKSLKLKLGDKEVTLTIDQARKLHGALGEMFGAAIIREEHHHHDHYPYRWWWATNRSAAAASTATRSTRTIRKT